MQNKDAKQYEEPTTGRRIDDDHTTLYLVNQNVLHLREDICDLTEKLEGYMKENNLNVENIKQRLSNVEFVVSGLRWVGGILGAALLLLLWAIFTGQVQLIFK